jgi:predicted dehydrogenase
VGRLIPALRQVKAARLALVCSRDPAKAKTLAAEWQCSRATTSWEEVFDLQAIDGVIVTGPPELHVEVVRRCINEGMPVYVEKPVAYFSAEIDQLMDLSRTHGGDGVFVGYNFAFSATLARLTDFLATCGEIRVAKLRFVSNKPRAQMWQCTTVLQTLLLAIGVHPIAILVKMFGAPVRVSAVKVDVQGDVISLHAWLLFSSGTMAALELSNAYSHFETRYEFLCRDGSSGLLENHARIGISLPEAAMGIGMFQSPAAVIEPGIIYVTNDHAGYVGALTSFVESIENTAPSASPLSLSLSVHQTIEQILAALQEGQGNRP